MPLGLLVTLMMVGSATSASRNPVVGTWTRTTTCAELANALNRPGLQKRIPEMIVGNGFIPGVASVGALRDRKRPCLGAVPRKHSHFFTSDGRFGSLDWNGEVVDDGTYVLKGNDRLTVSKEFPSVTFRYVIRGKEMRLTPLIPQGCASFRCAWSVSVAYPGKTWARTPG